MYLEEYVWKDVLPHFFAETLPSTTLVRNVTIAIGNVSILNLHKFETKVSHKIYSYSQKLSEIIFSLKWTLKAIPYKDFQKVNRTEEVVGLAKSLISSLFKILGGLMDG